MGFIRTGERSIESSVNGFRLRQAGLLKGVGSLPTLAGIGGNGAGSTTVLLAYPTTDEVLEGDLLLAFFESSGGDSPTAPAGWTHVSGSPFVTVADNTGSKLSIFFRYVPPGGIGGTSVSITVNGDHGVGRLLVFRGAVYDPASGPPVISSTETGSAVTTHTWAEGSTPASNCLVLLLAADEEDNSSTSLYSNTLTSAGNLTNVGNHSENRTITGNGGGWAMWVGTLATKGSIGTVTATRTSGARSNLVAIAIVPSFALPA